MKIQLCTKFVAYSFSLVFAFCSGLLASDSDFGKSISEFSSTRSLNRLSFAPEVGIDIDCKESCRDLRMSLSAKAPTEIDLGALDYLIEKCDYIQEKCSSLFG